MKHLILFLSVAFMFASCNKRAVYTEPNPDRTTSVVMGTSSRGEGAQKVKPVQTQIKSYYPKATAFTMSGDYANNVGITLGPDGTITYFPAPTDLSQASKPVAIGDGWWLNNQGLSRNSVFTTYTFEEYMALPAPPSIEQLKESIILGARVTAMKELPYSIGEARKIYK